MKNLFDIVQENPTNFEKKEIEDLAEGFIKEYDADITPKDKVKLRKELETEIDKKFNDYSRQLRNEEKVIGDEHTVFIQGLNRAVKIIRDYLYLNYQQQLNTRQNEPSQYNQRFLELAEEFKIEVKMEGDEILYKRRREWIEEYYINSPPITTIRRLIAAETDNGAKVMNDLADDLVNKIIGINRKR